MARPIKNDKVTLRQRLEAGSIPEPNTGCHLWFLGLAHYGYGKIGIRDQNGKPKTVTAHRLSWELENGPVPAGMVVMHKCDVPACINLAHLRLGTQADNLADMWIKGRAKPGVIPSDGRSNSKLTWETVRFIRMSSLSAKRLARELGVSDVLIGRVRNGNGWKEPAL